MVITSVERLKGYMEKSGMGQLTPDNLQSYFKSMSKETVDSYLANGGVLHTATVGPSEAILVPFNHLFAERVGSAGDVVGIR
eukprot:7352735-Pyramimonas_sp.AAC.1